MQPRIAGRFEAGVGAGFNGLGQAARLELDPSPKAVPIGTCPDELDADPVPTLRIIAQEQGRTVEDREQEVFGAAVEEVSRRGPSSRVAARKWTRGWTGVDVRSTPFLWQVTQGMLRTHPATYPNGGCTRSDLLADLFELSVTQIVE